jgi:mRNA-degrading endonuclease RelE of RelBE toxin-antitoxin system
MRFLEQSPDIRQLPVVLISTTNLDRTYLIDRRELAFKLQGLAHVISLDASTRWFNDDLPLAHKCFDGAVRIYLPGYQPADASAVHRWWHKDKFASDCIAKTTDEIIRFIIEKTHPRFRIHPLFPQLQSELNEYRQSTALRRNLAAQRQALTEEQEGMFEEFYAEYAVLEKDRDEWKELAERRYDEIRTLRFRINQQWETDDSVTDETVVEPLRLSRQALESFQKLDEHEQSRIHSTLFAKLAEDELREAQSEIRQALDGSCWIYPRGHSSNGQRVIYTLNNDIVYVCELYAKHDDYEYAWNQGITLADYEEFSALPAWE